MEISAIKEALTTSLQSVAAKTEGIFLSLSAVFPSLFKEMKGAFNTENNENSQSILNISKIEATIAETFSLVEELSKKFTQNYDKDRVIYGLLDTQINEIRTLNQFIDQIREDSSAMELISLNAMTVALKAGSSGRAFSFITEELKRLSSKTIELTQTVIEQGGVILNNFEEFSTRIKENTDLESKMFSNFTSRAHTSFEQFNKGIEEILDIFLDMKNKSKNTLNPMSKIMEEIQKQDLIRQSIDQIVISLEEIQELGQSPSIEEELDELAFLKLLPTLCISVLRDIKSTITGSTRVFKEQITLSQKAIDTIERERNKLVERTINSRNESSIERVFESATRILDDLLGDVEHVFTIKRRTVESSKDMVKKVLTLDDIFRSFASLITRFHTIDIASRIEIAKQEVLKQMSGTVDEMTRLTSQIEADVAKSKDVTSNFLSTVQEALEQYRNAFNHQIYSASRAVEKLKLKFSSLLQDKNELIREISSLRIFEAQFLSNFNDARKTLEQVNELINVLDSIEGDLETIKFNAEESFQKKLSESRYKDWRLRDRRLKEVIERFTIFTHKKMAGDLLGFEVEGGVVAGEVNLF